MSKPVAVVSDLWGYILSVSCCKYHLIKNTRNVLSRHSSSLLNFVVTVVDVSRYVLQSVSMALQSAQTIDGFDALGILNDTISLSFYNVH